MISRPGNPRPRSGHDQLRRSVGLSLRLAATLAHHHAGRVSRRRCHSAACGRHPLANPVLIAVTFVSIIVVAIGTSFPAYFAGAQFVHFLLGPATVALAVPLVRHLPQVRRALVPMLVALVAGSAHALACAVWLALASSLHPPAARAPPPP